MFPPGAAAILVIALLRYLRGKGLLGKGLLTGSGSRPLPTTLPLGGTLAFITLLVMTPIFFAVGSSGGFIPVALIALCAVCVLIPGPLTELVLVPLGWVRATWTLHRIAGGSTRAFEARSSRALPAARALLRNPTEENAVFVESRVTAGLELGTTGAATLALVALSRGDRDTARDVFDVLDGLVKGEAPASVVELARDFLALDAASRGNFARVATLGEKRPRGKVTRLLALLSPAFVDGERPSNRRAWFAWWLSPRRELTRPLVERALSAPVNRPLAAVSAGPGAIAALVVVPVGEVRPVDLSAAVKSLDEMRESAEWHATVARRALAIAPGLDGRSAIDSVLREAEQDLVEVMMSGRLPLRWLPKSPSGDLVRERVREERVARVEALMQAMARRTKLRQDLPEFDEWRAYGDLRRAIDDVTLDASTPAAFQVVFRIVYTPLTSYGVRLINIRTRRVLAREVFRFLRDLGHSANATDAYELLGKNFSACAADRLPRVKKLEGEIITHSRRMRIADALLVFSWLSSFFAAGATPALFSGLHDNPARGIIVTALIATTVVGLFASTMLLVYRAEVALVPDGLVVQNGWGRYVALRADVESPRVLPGGVVWFRLRRHPRWLPKRVWTRTESRERATECANGIASFGK